MSSDNCIAILVTTDKFKKVSEHCIENTFGKGITAYRVAHAQAIDSFDYLKYNELHNLGAWLQSTFPDNVVVYSKEEAHNLAVKYLDIVGYTEYGILEIDASEYNFPGY